jgi:release factor glutamine methyltransferase
MQTSPESREPEWTIQKLLRWTSSYFASHDIESPRAAAEILLADSLKLERIDLYLRHDQPLVQDELRRYKALIKRRLQREPVAYIVGHREFWSMTLEVSPAVLIPRPETECLVERALQRLPSCAETGPLRVLELGTGSGAVILAVASERPGHHYFASDRSLAALSVAARNARRHGLRDAVCFVCGDWVAPFGAAVPRFDIILVNPPYIPSGEIRQLEPEIHRYEPPAALDGGSDGLRSIRTVIESAPAFLKTGGHLLIEIGDSQGEVTARIARSTGAYDEIGVDVDYSDRPRVARMRRQAFRDKK